MDSSSVDKFTFHRLVFVLTNRRLVREFEENSYNHVIAEPDQILEGLPGSLRRRTLIWHMADLCMERLCYWEIHVMFWRRYHHFKQ